MLELEDAQQRLLSVIAPRPAETVPLPHAAGRFLAEDIAAPMDLPPFDNSAMDGYAVRAADLASATAQSPVELRLMGQVAAGGTSLAPVAAGTCARIFTGAPLPPGADAVVMQEDTTPVPDAPGRIRFQNSAAPAQNVRPRGDDVRQGTGLPRAGIRLTPARLSLLAACGLGAVRVARQPTAGLLATGSELREAGQPLQPGQIYECNRIGLAAQLPSIGAVPRVYPIVADTLPQTRAALTQALPECDALITTGGVSVGELDFVKAAFTDLGGELMFWKVAMKPGKPFAFGRWRDKFFFGLPGNPVSALVTFLLLVRPALLRWQGAGEVFLPSHPGVLAEPLVNRSDRRSFLGVKVDPAGRVRLSGPPASHRIRSFAEADGLVDVAPATTLPEGTTVPVLRWEI